MNSIAKGAMIVAVCLIAEFGKHLGCLRVIADNMGRTPAPAAADVAVQDIPVSVPFGHLLLITAGTLVLSLVVSIIPAAKAGREKPLDTLRKM